jgi:hypothetical protein
MYLFIYYEILIKIRGFCESYTGAFTSRPNWQIGREIGTYNTMEVEECYLQLERTVLNHSAVR